jgi:hypothetical protein
MRWCQRATFARTTDDIADGEVVWSWRQGRFSREKRISTGPRHHNRHRFTEALGAVTAAAPQGRQALWGPLTTSAWPQSAARLRTCPLRRDGPQRKSGQPAVFENATRMSRSNPDIKTWKPPFRCARPPAALRNTGLLRRAIQRSPPSSFCGPGRRNGSLARTKELRGMRSKR